MPLAAADPRPRNPFGQFSPGAALSPDQMNRAYGIRTKVLASILSTRPTMKTIPALSAKDIARISGLAAKARRLVNLEKLDLGEKPVEPTLECSPCAANAKPAKVWYPSIYIGSRTNAGDKLAEIPRKGKAVIEYRVRDITTTEDAEGKVTSSASLEVQSIDPVAADDGAQVAPIAGAEFTARIGNLIGFGRGDYAIAAMVRSGKLTAQEASTGYSRLLARQSVMNTAKAVASPKLAAQRSYLAKALIKDRAAPSRVALSALAKRAVELAAPAPVVGDKIQRPQFVEDGGYVKIVRPDGTASKIGRAPGMMNRLRRNKDKLIVGGLTTAVGAAFARELLRGRRLGKKA